MTQDPSPLRPSSRFRIFFLEFLKYDSGSNFKTLEQVSKRVTNN